MKPYSTHTTANAKNSIKLSNKFFLIAQHYNPTEIYISVLMIKKFLEHTYKLTDEQITDVENLIQQITDF